MGGEECAGCNRPESQARVEIGFPRKTLKSEIQCGREAGCLSSEQVKEIRHWNLYMRTMTKKTEKGPLSLPPIEIPSKSHLRSHFHYKLHVGLIRWNVFAWRALYSPLLWFIGGRIPTTTKAPDLLPYLVSYPSRSDLFGEERNPACITQLLAPPVLLGAASPPEKGLLLLLKAPCSEGRLADSVLQHEEACMRADGNHTLHHSMCNQHIFPTSLPYFTFCSEHRWTVGEAIVASLQS